MGRKKKSWTKKCNLYRIARVPCPDHYCFPPHAKHPLPPKKTKKLIFISADPMCNYMLRFSMLCCVGCTFAPPPFFRPAHLRVRKNTRTTPRPIISNKFDPITSEQSSGSSSIVRYDRSTFIVQKSRHYSGNRHLLPKYYYFFWLFPSVPKNDFTGTIVGNRHYSTGIVEGQPELLN